MKQTFTRLTAGLLLALSLFAGPLSVPALAEGEETAPPAASEPAPEPTPAPTQDPGTVPATSGEVYVTEAAVTDTAGGEVQQVQEGDRINVVLRQVDHPAATYNVTADEIVARVNSTIFTYTGTAEVSQLTEGEDAQGAYYTYVLLFRDVIFNGGGNQFAINLSYQNTSMAMQQLAPVLGQCSTEAKENKTPSLIVRSSSYGTETITAGSPFTLSLTLYATNGTEAVNDVVASVTLPEGVTMSGGSLSTYLGSMSAGSTRDVSFNLQAGAGFSAGVANITVNMVGAGADTGTAVSGSTTVSVPISQPDRFELGQLQVSDSIYLGDTATVTLNFVNKGKNPVANLEASLTGENLGADMTQQYIGNVNAGTENSVDFDLVPTTTGTVTGSIVLNYEAEDGSLKTVSKDFSINVMEMPAYDDTMMDPGMVEPTAQPGLPVCGIVLIAVAVVVAVVAVILVVRRRKKKKAASLADLEAYDEDL